MRLLKLIAIITIFVTSFKSFSQARVDYTSTAVTMTLLQKNGKWAEYPDFKKTEVPIKIDFEKNRIVVYSEIEQMYRIGEYYPEKENEKEFINFFRCLSSTGETTEITIKTSKKTNFSQMYIKDKTRILIYNMKKV